MDSLDVAILREMGRSRVLWWSRADPRVGAEEIANAVGVHPSTVRARLRQWSACGFLRGLEVLPNPSAVGAVLGGGTLRVDDPCEKDKVVERLAEFDGVIAVSDYVGPWFAIALAAPDPAGFERRRRALVKVEGISDVEECQLYGAIACNATPSPLDWRVVQALRRHPKETLAACAQDAGISGKTFTKRYARLTQEGALWLCPAYDFTRYSGAAIARLIIHLDDATDGRALVPRARAAVAEPIEATSVRDLGIGYKKNVLELIFHVESVGLAEEGQKAALRLPGVREVELLFPKRYHVFPQWFDGEIERRVAQATPIAR